MPLPYEEHEDGGSEPVPGDDSTDPACDDGNVHPVSHQVSQPTEVTGKLPRDCCIPERSSATSNTTPMAHNVAVGEQSDTKSPPQDTQSSDSSQGPEEDFNMSSPSPAEDHSSGALGLPRSTPSEFSVQQTPQQGTSRPLDFDVQSLPSECATPYMQSVEEGQQKKKQEEEEEEKEQQQQQQIHSVFHSSEHPHFPHCLPAQSEIVHSPPPSQPSWSSDVYTVPANYSCGHSCNRAAQSLPTIQCNGTARHLCVYNPPPSRPSQSSHVYMSKPVQPEDRTAMDRNEASKHVLVCGQPSELKTSCSSGHQGMLVCGKETRERNYELKCELFSTTLSSATTHMPLPCPLSQNLPTADAMSKSVDEAEYVVSEENSSLDVKRCPAAEPSADVPPDIMPNHTIPESDDPLGANEDQVNSSPPVRRKNKRHRRRKK